MKIRQTLLIATLAAGLSACGGKKDETAPGPPAGQEVPEGEAKPAETEGEPDEGDPARASAEPTEEPARPADVPADPAAPTDPLAAPPDVAGAPADAERSASGLAWRVLKPGTGTEHPSARDSVEVHYTGWTTDGKMFDSSRQRGAPAKFPLGGVIPGWTEGVQLMKVGEQRRFWIPGNLAYGETPSRPGAPAGTLVFDIELLAIEKAPTVDAPSDVAGPPDSATRTDSGLAYRVLTANEDGDRPTADSTVRVHYSGWTTDGQLFDSSVTRRQPATFPLRGVIPGWTEGLQLMRVGEKVRFWIPANLAYGETPSRPGAPAGMLVFDVELLAIVN